MSARSRDLISATLINAGIIGAGEIHMAAGGDSTSAFQTYWNDWFDNERFHNSTNDIKVGYDAMTAGRNDVLLVGPGTHSLSTALVWDHDDTHMVGVGAVTYMRPSAIIQPRGAVSPLITVTSTGTLFAGLTLRNGQSTGSTACVSTLYLSSGGSYGFTMRNSFIWGPEDDSVNDSTASWHLIRIGGNANLFENCLIGFGWPISGAPNVSEEPCLVWYDKSVFNSAEWNNCTFHAEFKVAAHHFMTWDYSPNAGNFYTHRNCQFYNIGSTGLTLALGTDRGNDGFSGQQIVFFDSDCAFHGVTDIGSANFEAYVKFPSAAHGSTTTVMGTFTGLAMSFDHTSG